MTNPGRDLLERVNDESEEVEIQEIVATIRTVDPEEFPAVLQAIGHLLNRDPSIVDDLLEAVAPELQVEREATRVAATRTISTVAAAAPQAVIPEIPELVSQFDDDSASVRGAAVRAFVSLSEDRPAVVIARLDAITPLVTDEVPFVGEAAVGVMRSLVEDHASEITPYMPVVVKSLVNPPEFDPRERRQWMRHHPKYRAWLDREGVGTADRERYLSTLAHLVSEFGAKRPDDLAEHVPKLAEVLARERSTTVRGHLLDAIAATADRQPEAGTPAIEPVVGVITDAQTDSLVAKATWTLAWLAEGQSKAIADAVAGQVPALIDALESDHDDLVGGAAAVLSYVAEHDPKAVQPALPHVREMLRSEDTQRRGLSIWILAFAGEQSDRARLERVVRDDQNSEVRDAADEAIALLEERVDT